MQVSVPTILPAAFPRNRAGGSEARDEHQRRSAQARHIVKTAGGRRT